MQVPLELSFRNVRSATVEPLIREQAAKLEKYCDHMTSCRVAVDRPHKHARTGNPYRVRIEVRVPPGHDIVVNHGPMDEDFHEPLSGVIRSAFKAVQRQLVEITQRQHGEVKTHDEPLALVARVFRDEGYGFLKTLDGRELYFHRNAVLHDGFDELDAGTQVRFAESEGEKGPQASTVQIVDRAGS